MPTNTFNIGKDAQLVVISPLGTRIDLSIVTGFNSKQDVHQVKVMPLNGPRQAVDLPDGWSGTFTLDRANSAVDDLISAIELGYWAGGVVGLGQIYHYVQEVNGSTSTYLYDAVTMHLSDAGHWKADDTVKQTITWVASTRKRV